MFKGMLFLAVILVVSLATHILFRNKLNIEKEYIYEPVNKIDKYGGIAILVVLLIGYGFVLFTTDYDSTFIAQFILLEGFILSLFRTYMQWKYNKEAKRYVLLAVDDVFGVIALLGILFVFPLA